ncbi:MAG: acetate--CoA ligase family protein, partial [Dehalococcoidia bacterium]|nr:acetate--CoA ligase family protein [Dehalococcoidia bacterium]
GHASRETVEPIMEHMIAEPDVGSLLVASSASEDQARHIINVRDRHDKLVAFLYTGNELGASTGLELLKDARVPVFHSPQNLASAMRQLHDYYDWRDSRVETGFAALTEMSPEQRATLAGLRSSDRTALTEHEAKWVLDKWGIPTTEERRASDADEAAEAAREIGYPVVLKIESPDILHKTEIGALAAGLADERALREAYDRITNNVVSHAPDAEVRGVLVQEMVSDGVEVIVGASYDSQLGPVLLYGLGGIFVEALRDVSLRLCPITRLDAAEMIAEVAGSRLLQGFRGSPRADIEALTDTLVSVSHMAVGLEGTITELDINPLAVLPEGRGVKALDALITLGR